jgi:hypothetical protein
MKRLLVGLVLFLGAGRVQADDPNEGANYQLGVAGSALAGAALGPLVSQTFDGDTGWGWSKTDTALELAFAGATVIDLMQTSWFRSRGDAERNPLLGRHPSQQEVSLGIGACILGHALVAAVLPKPFRSMWQGGGIGVEVSATVWNHNMGVGLKVPW